MPASLSIETPEMAHSMESYSLNPSALTQEPATKSLRVLSVIPGDAAGASMIFAKRQVTALQELGVISQPFFLSSRTSPTVLIRERQRFQRETREFRPDVIHAHFGTMTAFFCAISGTSPLVVTYRGSDLNPCPSINWLRSAVGRFLSQITALRASRIICVSEQLKARLAWTKQCVVVIPSGVDTHVFYPRPRSAARSELGWGTEERVVLFNASKYPIIKRLDLAQAAVEIARSRCGAIRFMILDGYTEPKIIPTMMNGADCLLLTSDWEGSPNVVKEAMACNLPVISVDVGDVRERLVTVYPSWIVPRDHKEIGKALAQILMRGERSNGNLAIRALSQEIVSIDTSSIYKAVLGLR